MIGNFFRRKKRVVFLYADRYQHSGSTIMRGEQLRSIVSKYYGDRYNLSYQSLSTNYNNCVIFLTKGAVTDITLEQLAELSRRRNYVMLDPVDNPLDQQKAHGATCVIAASQEAFNAYRAMGLRTFLVNHHVDIRLARTQNIQLDSVRCGYFGELVNTVMTDSIAKYVDFIHVDTGKQSTDWLTKPLQYNLHYAVRANNVEAFKPFLKGFTAAACNANIIIQRDQKEAVFWLGDDYPYLLNPNPTEDEILNMLDHIKNGYRNNEWTEGLRRMKAMQLATSDEAVAREFNTAVEAIIKL